MPDTVAELSPLMKISACDGPPTPVQATCGWPCWSPKFLRRFCTFPYFMFCLCANAMLQGMIVNGLVSTSISSIEKRFDLSSTKSGIFSATYDVAVFVMLVPLSYYANKVNKVRVIGLGMVLVGIGSIMNTLPHFFDGNYFVGQMTSDVCDKSRQISCDSSQVVSPWSFPVLIIAQALIGFGAAPIFTYGYSTIDELDSTSRTARNMAFYMAAATVGPAIAFIGGGQLLRVWGDTFKTNYQDLGISGPNDPRWYGAWWLGFDIVGVLSIIMAIPLTMFPSKLRDTDERKKGDSVQTHSKLNIDFSGEKFALLKTFRLFLLNWTCMGLIAMQTLESLIMNGYITFVPKLFEHMFGFSSSQSSTYTGIIVVPMGVIGSLFGGWLSKKVNNHVRPMLKISIVLTILALFASFCMMIRCDDIMIAGINTPYSTQPSTSGLMLKLEHSCNAGCQCDSIFNPVCGPGGVSFFSPCHAACTNENPLTSSWSSCSCLTLRNATSAASVTKGWCKNECSSHMIIFFIVFAFLCLFVFALAPLIQSVSLRIVSTDHRDSYICFSWLWMRALGSVPGAILFGNIIDQTCRKWISSCGDGSAAKCVLYDADLLGKDILVFSIIIKILCALALFVTMKTYTPMSDEEETGQSKEPQEKAGTPVQGTTVIESGI